MINQQISDDEIVRGFREGTEWIIREYFYGYCRVGYQIFDQRYQLSQKENLDFMSLAHQYALYLIEHDWKSLDDRSPNVSLKTWLINGFRYVVLEALKWYQKEYGTITFEEYLQTFDVSSNLRLQFNRTVQDICDHAALSRQERIIIDLLLLQGFKTKEVAEKLGMTPSAISQKYSRVKEQIIVPYFKKYFDMDLEAPEVMDERAEVYAESLQGAPMAKLSVAPMADEEGVAPLTINSMKKEMKRTTPEFITELQAGEIFVFGSNLRGLHGGGAAYLAYHKFGAVMGQGVGLQGQSYGIPTMQGGVETIRPYVDEFIEFAKAHRELTFLVTRIGCGIAGFRNEEIAPLFAEAHDVENIVLPEGW